MIGRVIGKYEITGELANGGTGAVYRGRHLHLPREVAIKSILLGAFSPSAQVQLRSRFRREAFIQSQLDHPNIVRVYEFFAAEDNYYLAMEYAPGMSLRDLLARQGAPSPAQAIYLLKQALAALDYAHNFGYLDESDQRLTGILHRDIKPANLLLDGKGKLKITDFGIARILGEQMGLGMTLSGFHPGTVEYTSPEQLLGLAIDARSDIYGLGVTFYEMLTGRLPFPRSATSSDWEIRKGHIENEPPPLLDLRPEAHPALAAIIMQSLRKSPNERYQSAAAFLEALQSYERRYSVSEQAMRSPAVKPAQPPPAKLLIDDLAAPIAQPPANQFSSASLTSSVLLAEDSPLPPAREDAATIPLASGGSLSTPAQAATPIISIQSSQFNQSGRRWLPVVAVIGLLLAAMAVGAMLLSRQKRLVSEQQAATTAPSPKLETPGSAAIGAASRPDASPTPGGRTAYQQAQSLERQERYDEAIRVYENYLSLHPDAEDAYVVNDRIAELRRFQGLIAAARVSADAGKLGLARRQYVQALQLRPNSPSAQTGLAEVEAKMPVRLDGPMPDRPPGAAPQFSDDEVPPPPPPREPRSPGKSPKPTPTPPDSTPPNKTQ